MSSSIITADECLTPSAGSQLNHFADLRVAIVHHWFVFLAGGERVVDTIASMFPADDLLLNRIPDL